ncbi:hypothetical protein BBF96_06085 [Anoxybacter fermentans]|uniref:Polymerase nucleotidyl transferase domain-containing protein n=1 Tax=Anoxybacter fermentans TaxID=1323375 RepID=A0A3S9SXH9_9FIRM|nr:nucleotidyltransferase domain-containing protein [Anoxybacter fermentans]AZR73001.1 hypothetical protein BBF96_06085 [Anoxybacter fermentans]
MIEKFEKVIDQICKELQQRDNLVGIILFGSLAKGNYHKGSDIDLYVVGEDEKDRVTFFYREGIPVQLLWRSVEDFKKKILKPTRDIPMGLIGKILYDPTGMIQKYMEKSRKLADQGPKPLTDHEKIMIRATLSQDMEIINGLLDKGKTAEAVILMNDLLLEAISAYYDIKKWWMPKRKHLISDLKNHHPDLGTLAEKIILETNPKEKFKKLYKLRNIVLDLMGGELKEFEIIF